MATAVLPSCSDEQEENVEEANDWKVPLCFVQSYHSEPIVGHPQSKLSWRMTEKVRTVGIVLNMCMNIGVDPPDVYRPSPCARDECWTNPFSLNSNSALETITVALQKQYEQWQPRAKFKRCLDPTLDEVKKDACSLRRHAKDERVLFHYNGHGVPRPTRNGEVWVFNKHYTQYIPLSLYDLQDWLSTPALVVWECNNAGICVEEYEQFATQHDDDIRSRLLHNLNASAPAAYSSTIQLAACGADEALPLNSSIPADLFTACLTTPIRAAVLWWTKQSFLAVPNAEDFCYERIPGRTSDRRTPLGELNWIFTAVTDSIAWNILDRETFQLLFRQDQLVASLFRNFLLACRIMSTYNCHPVSRPRLPPDVGRHWMWQAWDVALDGWIRQICEARNPSVAVYEPSTFFADHLKSFDVWLKNGWQEDRQPEHLPIVLQVLLSPTHRIQALELLTHFLDLGPRAVLMALQVGIFPYVSKLLQSSSHDLRVMLVFVWAKVVAVDASVQGDLVKDNGFRYFIDALVDYDCTGVVMPEHLAQAAFVLASIVHDYPMGQEACASNGLVAALVNLLHIESALLRKWCLLCLGRLWQNNTHTRGKAVAQCIHLKLFPLVTDQSPEVRTALVFALGTYLSEGCQGENMDVPNYQVDDSRESFQSIVVDQAVGSVLSQLVHDGSPLVRIELCSALDHLAVIFPAEFAMAVTQVKVEQRHVQDVQSIVSLGGSFARLTTPSGSPSSTPSGSQHMPFDFAAPSASLSSLHRAAMNAHSNPCSSRASSEDEQDGDDWVRVPAMTRPKMAAASTSRTSVCATACSQYHCPVSSPIHSHFRGVKFIDACPDDALALTVQAGLPVMGVSPPCKRPLNFGSRGSMSPDCFFTPLPAEAQSEAVAAGVTASPSSTRIISAVSSIFASMWRAIMLLGDDPHPDVRHLGQCIQRRVREQSGLSGEPTPPGSPKSMSPAPRTIMSSPKPAANHTAEDIAASTSLYGLRPALRRRVSSPNTRTLTCSTAAVATATGAQQPAAAAHPAVAAVAMAPGDSVSRLFSFSRSSSVAGDAHPATPSLLSRVASIPRMSMTAPSTPVSKKPSQSLILDTSVISAIREVATDDLDDTIQICDLTSGFSDWCSAQFSRPSTDREKDSDQHGQTYLERHWRYEHNHNLRQHCVRNKEKYGDILHLDDQQFLCRGNDTPTAMRFHPYQNELVVSDRKGITVFDLEKGESRNVFSNSHPSKIVTLDYVNAHDHALLMAGTSDGCIRLWRSYLRPGREVLVTAWRALSELIPMQGGVTSGLVVDWEQESGVLFASGYVKVIRVWDTQREQIIQDIPTCANSCITSMASDVAGRSLLIAGCGDGTVRLYDRRLPATSSMVHMLKEHAGWVVKVFLEQGASLGKIITASTAGDVLYWDPRFTVSTKSINTHSTISCMDVHPSYPVFAVGSKSRCIKIYSIKTGERISTIQHHEGFLGQRIQQVSTLGFHPYQALLGAGFSDSLVSVYRDVK